MAGETNSKLQTYLTNTVFVGTASTDLTFNLIRQLKTLTGDMTARFKSILASAGAPN